MSAEERAKRQLLLAFQRLAGQGKNRILWQLRTRP
jgi:hypothetical protein